MVTMIRPVRCRSLPEPGLGARRVCRTLGCDTALPFFFFHHIITISICSSLTWFLPHTKKMGSSLKEQEQTATKVFALGFWYV